MENVESRIYLLKDSLGHKTAVTCGDSSDMVMVCAMQTPHGVTLHFESEAFHLSNWCFENEIELRVISRVEKFDELWVSSL